MYKCFVNINFVLSLTRRTAYKKKMSGTSDHYFFKPLGQSYTVHIMGLSKPWVFNKSRTFQNWRNCRRRYWHWILHIWLTLTNFNIFFNNNFIFTTSQFKFYRLWNILISLNSSTTNCFIRVFFWWPHFTTLTFDDSTFIHPSQSDSIRRVFSAIPGHRRIHL